MQRFIKLIKIRTNAVVAYVQKNQYCLKKSCDICKKIITWTRIVSSKIKLNKERHGSYNTRIPGWRIGDVDFGYTLHMTNLDKYVCLKYFYFKMKIFRSRDSRDCDESEFLK